MKTVNRPCSLYDPRHERHQARQPMAHSHRRQWLMAFVPWLLVLALLIAEALAR